MHQRLDVPRPVWSLGIVSLLTDLSSEMIFSVFALAFMILAGGSARLLGLIEGLADFSACSLDALAGWYADRTGSHKRVTVGGYAFSAAAKLMPILTATVAGLSVFRVLERLGKSVRGPPRDAWLSAVAPATRRGYAFGIHKALDKTGAVIGPLIAYGLMAVLGDSTSTLRVVFLVALLPAVAAVWVLLRVEAPSIPAGDRRHRRVSLKDFSPNFRRYLVSAATFSLGYFSFAFLLLKAHECGFSNRAIVLLYALYNAVFVFTAPVFGRLGDRIGRGPVMLLGYALSVLVNLGFSSAVSPLAVTLLFVLYGVFYSIDEAQGRAFVADLEPERTGFAIGSFNFVMGLSYVPASLLAGWLWGFDSRLPFLFAAGCSVAAIASFLHLRPDRGLDASGT
jgi:MFS family permease